MYNNEESGHPRERKAMLQKTRDLLELEMECSDKL